MQSTFFPNKGKSLEQAVAIRVVGNTAPTGGIADGKYVFLKGHSTLPDGGYKANGAIQAGATLTSSNLTATSDGFVNDAYSALSSDLGSPSSASCVTGNDAFSKISTLNSKITPYDFGDVTVANFEAAIKTYVSNLSENGARKPIRVNITSASGVFSSDRYTGWIYKQSASYYSISLIGRVSNDTVTGMYNASNETFEWTSLNSKIDQRRITQIGNHTVGTTLTEIALTESMNNFDLLIIGIAQTSGNSNRFNYQPLIIPVSMFKQSNSTFRNALGSDSYCYYSSDTKMYGAGDFSGAILRVFGVKL